MPYLEIIPDRFELSSMLRVAAPRKPARSRSPASVTLLEEDVGGRPTHADVFDLVVVAVADGRVGVLVLVGLDFDRGFYAGFALVEDRFALLLLTTLIDLTLRSSLMLLGATSSQP